jgi:5-methylcytosine-specific restriction endonuclease McrA
MNFSAGTDHPLSVTYDHVQPAALGGSRHRKNLKLAHRYCNNFRGTQEISDDLRTHCRSKIQDIVTNDGF